MEIVGYRLANTFQRQPNERLAFGTLGERIKLSPTRLWTRECQVSRVLRSDFRRRNGPGYAVADDFAACARSYYYKYLKFG